MKRFKKFMVRYGSFTASLAMALSFWFSNKTCFFICHQPEEPEALKRLVKRKRGKSEMTITENNTLEMKNVVSFRGKVTQQKMEEVMRNFENLIQENKACKTGPTVTVTYAVENEFGQSVMDIEVLIPLDKKK